MRINICGLQMPSHDPPVAWKVGELEDRFGVPVVSCPAFAFGYGLADTVRWLDPEPVLLDAEPGRLS